MLLCALLLASTPAPQDVARAVSSDPSASTFRFHWRRKWRSVLSAPIPFWGDVAEAGFAIRLHGLLELSNFDNDIPVPFQHWRGRVALEFAHQWLTALDETATALTLSLWFTHESSHTTQNASPFGTLIQPVITRPVSIQTNEVGLRTDATFDLRWGEMTAVVMQRFHYASCTLEEPRCDLPVAGFAYEVNVELIASFREVLLGLAPFVSLHTTVMPESQNTHRELRTIFSAGLDHRSTAGTFFGYASLWLGNEVSRIRMDSIISPGFGVGWTP